MDAKDELSEGPLITDPELSKHNPDNPSLTGGIGAAIRLRRPVKSGSPVPSDSGFPPARE
jgi:hypothetical protein